MQHSPEQRHAKGASRARRHRSRCGCRLQRVALLRAPPPFGAGHARTTRGVEAQPQQQWLNAHLRFPGPPPCAATSGPQPQPQQHPKRRGAPQRTPAFCGRLRRIGSFRRSPTPCCAPRRALTAGQHRTHLAWRDADAARCAQRARGAPPPTSGLLSARWRPAAPRSSSSGPSGSRTLRVPYGSPALALLGKSGEGLQRCAAATLRGRSRVCATAFSMQRRKLQPCLNGVARIRPQRSWKQEHSAAASVDRACARAARWGADPSCSAPSGRCLLHGGCGFAGCATSSSAVLALGNAPMSQPKSRCAAVRTGIATGMDPGGPACPIACASRPAAAPRDGPRRLLRAVGEDAGSSSGGRETCLGGVALRPEQSCALRASFRCLHP
jgi:hypothetical protein